MIVKPASGALVRDPLTRLAVEAGATVDPNDPYWARLIADGDLVEVPEHAAKRGASSTSREGADK